MATRRAEATLALPDDNLLFLLIHPSKNCLKIFFLIHPKDIIQYHRQTFFLTQKLSCSHAHGVADAKWVYENCNGAPISIIDGKYKADDAMKGPLGKKALTPLRGAANFDPTDPAV